MLEKTEITLTATRTFTNPYTGVDVWVDLKGPSFKKRCYGFWDGGQTFRVRVTAHRGAKFSLFEGGIRVPAILSWPAVIPPRQAVRELAVSADIFPTFTKAAGGKLPADRTIDGRDILPVAANRAATPHKEMFWGGPSGQAAVRRGNWKYIRNPIEADGTETGMKPLSGDDEQYLSDLGEDPGERKNLRRVMPDLASELDRAVGQWLEEVKKP